MSIALIGAVVFVIIGLGDAWADLYQKPASRFDRWHW